MGSSVGKFLLSRNKLRVGKLKDESDFDAVVQSSNRSRRGSGSLRFGDTVSGLVVRLVSSSYGRFRCVLKEGRRLPYVRVATTWIASSSTDLIRFSTTF